MLASFLFPVKHNRRFLRQCGCNRYNVYDKAIYGKKNKKIVFWQGNTFLQGEVSDFKEAIKCLKVLPIKDCRCLHSAILWVFSVPITILRKPNSANISGQDCHVFSVTICLISLKGRFFVFASRMSDTLRQSKWKHWNLATRCAPMVCSSTQNFISIGAGGNK